MSETSEACGHRTVTDASIMRFGTLTGDYAQMHFDLDFGPANGMGGTADKRFKLRFRHHRYPGN